MAVTVVAHRMLLGAKVDFVSFGFRVVDFGEHGSRGAPRTPGKAGMGVIGHGRGAAEKSRTTGDSVFANPKQLRLLCQRRT